MNPQLKPQPTSDTPLEGRVMFGFAHDLRTHLRTILTRIQLIQRGGAPALPEEDQQLLNEAGTACVQMQGLIAAMVAYNEAGLAQPEDSTAKMRLSILLRGLALESKNAVERAGGSLEIANELDPEVATDLKKVLKELVTNACKFRDPQRPLRIVIKTQQSDQGLEITVADEGIGVAPEFLDRIFTPFQRLNGKDTYEGYGLGLATARRMVESWGGRIQGERDPDNRFVVRLNVPVE